MRLGSIIRNKSTIPTILLESLREKIEPTLENLLHDMRFDQYIIPAFAVGDNWIQSFFVQNSEKDKDERKYYKGFLLNYEGHDIREAISEEYKHFSKFNVWPYVYDKHVFIFPWSSSVEEKIGFYIRIPKNSRLPSSGILNSSREPVKILLFPNQNPYQVETIEGKINIDPMDLFKFRLSEKSWEDALYDKYTTRIAMSYNSKKETGFNVIKNFFDDIDIYGKTEHVLDLYWVLYGNKGKGEKLLMLNFESLTERSFPLGKIPGRSLEKYAQKRAKEISEEYALPVQLYKPK